jgi:hypothetical protein
MNAATAHARAHGSTKPRPCRPGTFTSSKPTHGNRGFNTQRDNLDRGPHLPRQHPWMAGLYWPYRRTLLDHPVRGARSGGFEGMALSPDGTKLYPMLERPLDGTGNQILIFEFDLFTQQYTARRWTYPYEPGIPDPSNNDPFDTGRHVGVHTPADNKIILVKLPTPLNRSVNRSRAATPSGY